jgi:putative oxidoreductase
VALGLVFFMHGYQKVFMMGMPQVSGFLGGLGIPLPDVMAYVLSYGELITGALLIIGLFTHWISKFMIVVALVAFFTVHMAKGFFISNGGYEFIMLIFAAALSIMITGPGKYSVDEMWMKKAGASL